MARATGAVRLGESGLRPDEVVAVARHGARVELTPEAAAAMARSRAAVEHIAASGAAVYGISTGFGALATVRVPAERRSELQHALIRSHAAGVGPPMPVEVVRAMMLLRARTLARGFSGVRPVVVQSLLAALNAGITPWVPRHGSLGASGDLAPLAHVALTLTGEGDVRAADGAPAPAAEELASAEIHPLTLEAREGLALINGTDGMLAMLVLACADAARLAKTADVAAAMSVEALLGTDRVFQPDVIRIRPHPGQQVSAANLVRLLAGSGIVASHRDSEHLVQDAYSVRCSPQVAGAARDALEHADEVAQRELDAIVDNPVVLEDGSVASTGNFHGAPLAVAADALAIAFAGLASISERRTDRLLDPARSQGLPAFLALEPGVDSGLMVAQYTAAALVAENRRLAAPASIDSLPTSAMQEDHVSMGWGACLKLRRLLENTGQVLAIEAICAARALDLRRPLQPAPGTDAARTRLREVIASWGHDRQLAPDLETAADLVRAGALVDAVEKATGPLE
jgi:histidine ammonia-lyase